jgi:uncharacterized membrane protein
LLKVVAHAVDDEFPLGFGDEAVQAPVGHDFDRVFGQQKVNQHAVVAVGVPHAKLAEHAIEIVADRGLNRFVTEAEWKLIIDGMRDHFQQGRYEAGLNAAIDAVDELLALHHPLGSETVNVNELPDRPWLR